jgi:hypothetical protein
LVVIEQQPGQIKLDTQPKAIAEQLLRHLLPHSGSLKSALLAVITSALSQQTALSGQTALSASTALSGQTALSAQTAHSGQTPQGSTRHSLSSGLSQYLGINNLLPAANTPTTPVNESLGRFQM